MEKKLIIKFDEYLETVEKLAIDVNKKFKPTVLVGIMRGAAPILDILSRILKLPIAYIVIQSYSGKGMEDQQGQLMFAREISSLAENKDFWLKMSMVKNEFSLLKGNAYKVRLKLLQKYTNFIF